MRVPFTFRSPVKLTILPEIFFMHVRLPVVLRYVLSDASVINVFPFAFAYFSAVLPAYPIIVQFGAALFPNIASFDSTIS